MEIAEVIFLVFAGLTGGAGIALALMRKVIYAAFLLFVILFGMAAMFVFAGAEFLAVTQIIVYVGGILILLLFGVMLTQKFRGEEPYTQIVNIIPGLLAAGLLMTAFIFLIRSVDLENLPWMKSAHSALVSDVTAIGTNTVTHFLLPFEAISILLLAALIGAAYLSRRSQTSKSEQA